MAILEVRVLRVVDLGQVLLEEGHRGLDGLLGFAVVLRKE